MIGLGLATLIGAGLSAAGGIAGNLINKNVAEQNIEAQKLANSQNIAFQKAENEITREREDNAVQRAAADMTAAGLSKTLAAGNPASAQSLSAPHTNAVNNQFKYESALQKMNIAGLLQDMAVKQKQLDMEEAKNIAQIDYIKAQTVGQNNINNTYEQTWENEYLLTLAKTSEAKSMTRLNDARSELQEKMTPYQVEQIQKDIDYRVAQIDLTNISIDKASEQILKIVAETNKLTTEEKRIAGQIITEQLTQKSIRMNQNYAMNNGLPVGVVPSGLVGGIIPAAQSMANMAYNGIISPVATGIKNFATGVWNGAEKLFGFGE